MKQFKRIWGDIRRWTNRTLVFHLQPIQELTPKGGNWKALDVDPVWQITPVDAPMPRGWYMLSVNLESNLSQMTLKLYPDYGTGYNENDSSVLHVPKGRICKRICHFPKIPKQLRLDPCEMPCEFRVKHLSMAKIPRIFAINRMEKKVYGKARSLLSTFINTEPAILRSLWQKYDELFLRHQSTLSGEYYQRWLQQKEHDRAIVYTFKQGSYQPLISVVVPIWNIPDILLRKCIDSVRHQSYPYWQLCLADDASSQPHVKEIIEEYARIDNRIEWVSREENGHICKASNSALELAKGEFIALLDHDDELSPHALQEVVKALNDKPDLDILYSDEDFIDIEGNRSNPHFKSDWNPELLKAHNYVTHLCVYRRSLIEKVDGFRENAGVEGAQDYDLLLRCSALTSGEQIHHIPKILYHWRAHEGSTALAAGEKDYSVEAGRKALQDFLDSQATKAKVEKTPQSNFYRVKYPIKRQPLVSILIPTRDALDVLVSCVDSIIKKTSYNNYEILIIDNQSRNPATLSWFEHITLNSKIRIIRYNHTFNYAAINNFGALQTKGELIALLNNDVEVITPEWLKEMVSLAVQKENGCIGAKLYYPDDTVQHAGVIIGLGGYAAHSHRGFPRNSPGYFNRLKVRQNLSAVTGACLLVRREIWEQLGGLDEELAIGYNDVDFCLRVREAGYLNVYTPFAELYHHESKTRGSDDTPEKIARFNLEKKYLAKRWGKKLISDPYYNPNLSHGREDFSLS
ncbi:MAG: glycosyltransferase family 2 protein [Desulforhopalus sp.]